MKRFILFFTLYVLFFLILLGFSQNAILLSLEDTKPYISEINFIVNDYNNNLKTVEKNIDEYIQRTQNIKNGFSSLEQPYVLNKYFKSEIVALEKLEKVLEMIKEDKEDINKYVVEYNQYCKLSQREIEKILKTTLMRVTYFNSTSYYKPEGFSLQQE